MTSPSKTVQVDPIVLKIIRLKDSCFREGYFGAGRALALAEKEIGWEIAAAIGKENIRKAKLWRAKNKMKVFGMRAVIAINHGFPPSSGFASKPKLWSAHNWRWLYDLEQAQARKKKAALTRARKKIK